MFYDSMLRRLGSPNINKGAIFCAFELLQIRKPWKKKFRCSSSRLSPKMHQIESRLSINKFYLDALRCQSKNLGSDHLIMWKIACFLNNFRAKVRASFYGTCKWASFCSVNRIIPSIFHMSQCLKSFSANQIYSSRLFFAHKTISFQSLCPINRVHLPLLCHSSDIFF